MPTPWPAFKKEDEVANGYYSMDQIWNELEIPLPNIEETVNHEVQIPGMASPLLWDYSETQMWEVDGDKEEEEDLKLFSSMAGFL